MTDMVSIEEVEKAMKPAVSELIMSLVDALRETLREYPWNPEIKDDRAVGDFTAGAEMVLGSFEAAANRIKIDGFQMVIKRNAQ